MRGLLSDRAKHWASEKYRFGLAIKLCHDTLMCCEQLLGVLQEV